MSKDNQHENNDQHSEEKRDFLSLLAVGMGAVGAGSFIWPVIDTMNPAQDVVAVSSTEVDLSQISPGQAITVFWRGKPVFIRHRTAEEIASAQSTPLSDLIDPQSDEDRVQKPQWLVMVGICTHLGCVPLGQKDSDSKGEFGGWFCPCHGSHYDMSGRIRKGPAPINLAVPDYTFISDNVIKIG